MKKKPESRNASDALQDYTLLVTLLDSEPSVWRRVRVPGGFTLAQLHDVLQIAMGWEESHLHTFTIGEKRYAAASAVGDDFGLEELDESKFTISRDPARSEKTVSVRVRFRR